MLEKMETEFRDVQPGQLYLERVEAAAMGVLAQSILDKDFASADRCIEIMQVLSIV